MEIPLGHNCEDFRTTAVRPPTEFQTRTTMKTRIETRMHPQDGDEMRVPGNLCCASLTQCWRGVDSLRGVGVQAEQRERGDQPEALCFWINAFCSMELFPDTSSEWSSRGGWWKTKNFRMKMMVSAYEKM